MLSSMAQPWQTLRECIEKGDVDDFVESVRHHLQAERGPALGSLCHDLLEYCFAQVCASTWHCNIHSMISTAA